jgi:DNA-binding ferritin-like protein
LARDYVTRTEFYKEHTKLEEHMIRIEEKLDRMLERQQKP